MSSDKVGDFDDVSGANPPSTSGGSVLFQPFDRSPPLPGEGFRDDLKNPKIISVEAKEEAESYGNRRRESSESEGCYERNRAKDLSRDQWRSHFWGEPLWTEIERLNGDGNERFSEATDELGKKVLLFHSRRMYESNSLGREDFITDLATYERRFPEQSLAFIKFDLTNGSDLSDRILSCVADIEYSPSEGDDWDEQAESDPGEPVFDHCQRKISAVFPWARHAEVLQMAGFSFHETLDIDEDIRERVERWRAKNSPGARSESAEGEAPNKPQQGLLTLHRMNPSSDTETDIPAPTIGADTARTSCWETLPMPSAETHPERRKSNNSTSDELHEMKLSDPNVTDPVSRTSNGPATPTLCISGADADWCMV